MADDRPENGTGTADRRDERSPDPIEGVDDETVVQTAAARAEDVVFSRVDRSTVEDLDVTVSFEDGVLTVEVYVSAPDSTVDTDRLADDAALGARSAVDDLFADGE
ncbi:MAG: DUF3194 domain-containing protein [Halobacteriaceae archaeon]